MDVYVSGGRTFLHGGIGVVLDGDGVGLAGRASGVRVRRLPRRAMASGPTLEREVGRRGTTCSGLSKIRAVSVSARATAGGTATLAHPGPPWATLGRGGSGGVTAWPGRGGTGVGLG